MTFKYALKKNRINNKKGKSKALVVKRNVTQPGLGIKPVPKAFDFVNTSRFAVQGNGQDSIRVKGFEYLVAATYTYDDTNYTGTYIPLNPKFWVTTRAGTFSDLYSNFSINRISFTYVPSVGTDTDGAVACGTIWHGAISATTLSNMVGALISSPGGGMGPIRNCFTSNLTLSTGQRGFYCDPTHGPDSYPCLFGFVIDTSATSDTTYGRWMVDYDISFWNSKLMNEFPHASGHYHNECDFTAAACTVAGQRMYYVYDHGSQTTHAPVAASVKSAATGDTTFAQYLPLVGRLYKLIDMYYVDSSQWTLPRRYFGISSWAGEMMSSIESAAKTINVFLDWYTATDYWNQR